MQKIQKAQIGGFSIFDHPQNCLPANFMFKKSPDHFDMFTDMFWTKNYFDKVKISSSQKAIFQITFFKFIGYFKFMEFRNFHILNSHFFSENSAYIWYQKLSLASRDSNSGDFLDKKNLAENVL